MPRTVASLVALVSLAVVLLVASAAPASSPPAGAVTVPSSIGQTASDSWTGTILPGSNPTNACNGLASSPEDTHTVAISVPAGIYSSLRAQFKFTLTWSPLGGVEDVADEILTVRGPDGSEFGSSDTGETTETVLLYDLPAGTYTVVACGFANAAPQAYTAKLEVTTTSPLPALASAPAQGLEFSASVAADNQRDEAEPLIEIDRAGNIYTCGPTGFSNAADYAQVSTDGGDQFHLLGTPPRGQQGSGGGGDCGLATGVAKNAQGNYQYAYSGLGPLTGFTSSTSSDNGRTLTTGGPQAAGLTTQGGGADRQWNTFLDDHTVLITYNQQAPRNTVVQTSTDGGLTYSPVASIAAPNPTFPGPLRFNPAYGSQGLVYFGWDKRDGGGDGIDAINLSISRDRGATWTTCRASLALGDAAGFVTVDHDSAGNLYLVYADGVDFHTYLVVLEAANVAKCSQPPTAQPTSNPGFSAPVQVDRDAVGTTVFPWVSAGGAPGRVAVAFYGTESDGNPNLGTFKATWNVYVNQSLDALSDTRTFSQVKATTHPFHYDSVCLNGLGCDLAIPPGDRSLADFFAIGYSPTSKKLSVVFDRGNKKPNEAAGHVASPMVVTQIGGPSNGGGSLMPTRPVVRTSSTDPTGDAVAGYSALFPGTAPRLNEPAADFVSASVGPEIDLHDGSAIANGGFTVTLKVADLSAAALQKALTDTGSLSLLWLWRFTNGYQDVAASARWNPVQGFTFGYDDFTTASAQCGSSGEKCIVYPGGTPIQGDADQATGTIRLSVPRYLLRALSGGSGNLERPSEVAAQSGSRFYDGTAFSLGNTVSPVQDLQSFLYPLDNTPAMDFLLPAGGGGGGGSGCKATGGGSIVGSGGEGRFTLDVHASLKGNVQYESANADFHSTTLASVACAGSSATIKGSGRDGDDTVTFTANVMDNGEPGTSDTFDLALGNGKRATGVLTRGNVQVK